MLILGIETTGKVASAALCEDDRVLAVHSYVTRLTHSQVILPLAESLLAETEREMTQVDLFAVSKGPGSYTGLRIGIAAVKGLCLAGNKPCAGISTLEELAYRLRCAEAAVFCVMKARQGVVYFGAYRCAGGQVISLHADRVCKPAEAAELALAEQGRVLITGDGAADLYAEYCQEAPHIALAPAEFHQPDAVALCVAAKNSKNITSADELDAAYLQETKAQKDRRHR